MLDRGERPIMTSNPQPPDRGRFIEGFSAAAVFNVAALFIVGSFFTRAGVPVGAMGIVQLAWIIPLWNSYRKKGKTEDAKGVVVAAVITFVLMHRAWIW